MNYYRKKPDLQALYAQKENAEVERVAEMEECKNLVRKCLLKLKQTLDQRPADIEEIRTVAGSCMARFKECIEERKFNRIGRFDINFILETEVKQLQRLYGTRR